MNAETKTPTPAEADKEALGTALEQQADGARTRRGRRRFAVMLSVPLLLASLGGAVWLTSGRYVTTDNAYVHQPILPVSAEVAGRIVEVDVEENAIVEVGAPLFRIDDTSYRIALDQADAALASARRAAEQQRTSYVTAQARLEAARDVLDLKQREFERQKELQERGVTSQAALDNASLAVRAASNDVTFAELAVNEALAALGGKPDQPTDEFPTVRAALAARETAAQNLEKTTIAAPAAGIVSQTGSLNVGQYVGPGAMVASLVENGVNWIDANFKETQVGTLREGQPVEISVDAYPGVTFHGEVQSLGSATGAQFSLIPAQNATGNWVKVVQRIPVHITIASDPDHPLRGGLSAHVSVDTGATRLDKLGWLK